ncbi:Class III chitinase [Penicillium cataractarum]|uniref:chitinase n=1 Tax=Penicillium cataractarum TaxID=2100454 RepID=A0A9W9SS64_9EURO|nr:Class III chitinase [Penicillium cataractarum]KAJ5381478.1 Class III chitinase [Penicillium cataractarum]
MRGYQKYLSGSVLLATLGGVQAKLDLTSAKNIAIYWGQNSLQGNGGQVQQPLAHYCENDDIDVIPLAFDMMINGPGGVPQVDFSVTSNDCDVFPGTQLKNCPKIGDDIATCQQKGKTILLSIGGATYSEGGFKSDDDAKAGAKLMWETFGPVQASSKALRPFGNVSIDGFDFDFEATVLHMATFANELRSLMDQDTSQQYFLTAAPQCPYPDQADKDILNGPVSIDAVFVQFYNNYCGVNNFATDETSSNYNFEEWDTWAKNVSQNKNVKVLIGVPADTTAASTGYIPASKLAEVIEYTKKFDSFGGVMMWDTTQAYANDGFIGSVRKALGGPDSGSSSPSNNAASTAVSAPSSTNTPETSPSSNAPDSSSSSSSSSGSASSSNGHEPSVTTTPVPEPTAGPKPPASTSTTKAPAQSSAAPDDFDNDDFDFDDETESPNNTGNAGNGGATNAVNNDTPKEDSTSKGPLGVISQDLFGLLHGLQDANTITGGLTHGLTKNLRRARRVGY